MKDNFITPMNGCNRTSENKLKKYDKIFLKLFIPTPSYYTKYDKSYHTSYETTKNQQFPTYSFYEECSENRTNDITYRHDRREELSSLRALRLFYYIKRVYVYSITSNVIESKGDDSD